MITPVELATWIALCVPWAEPRLASALVTAGSNSRPYLIASLTNEISDQAYRQSVAVLEKAKGGDPATAPHFIGLTQIPLSDLSAFNLSPDIVLDKCTNLQIGYALFEKAYALAEKAEKAPWKRISAAFNLYRSKQAAPETAYSKRAIDHLMNSTPVSPASMNDPVYHAVLAEWAAGLAQRHAMRTPAEQPTLINESVKIAAWSRSKT